MNSAEPEPVIRAPDLADDVISTVRHWLKQSSGITLDRDAGRLAALLRDPAGLDFALGFIDGVARPEDLRVAARNLERVGHNIPAFLPWYARVALLVGGGFATVFPRPIVPISRWVLRRMVRHLIVDATPKRLDKTLAALRGRHVRLNLNLIGEAVLGDAESGRRLQGTRELLQRGDVDYVSIKVSAVVAQRAPWGFEDAVARAVERLTPLYEIAAVAPNPKLITLDMEEFRDLDLTVAVFRRILDQPQLRLLEAGIALQAYLPDSLPVLQELTAWAADRRAAGGAGIRVRLVKGANLPMERVDAAMHGWPLATLASKVETDTHFIRLLDWVLTPTRTDAVRVGVATHNLFDLAFAWLLAKQRRVDTRVEFEMLLGMATAQATAVRRDVGGLRLYTPVVHPDEFDSAVTYLVRRLDENAGGDNFLSAASDLGTNDTAFQREAGRFRASLAGLGTPIPASNRVQDRLHPVICASALSAFENEPLTDPSIAHNREWASHLLDRSANSELGSVTAENARVSDVVVLESLIRVATTAGVEWGNRVAPDRARVLHDAGDVLSAYRGRLIEVLVSEAAKTFDEADAEASEAVDVARYYAERALDLDRVAGATFEPDRLTVVASPGNFPVAVPAGSVFAALAVGSAVILKPAPLARRCAAVLAEALWEAGVPRSVLVLANIDDNELGTALIADPAVDRVLLTGSWETAALFRSWRADLPLIAETSGKNAIVVTPAADLDRAVADIVRSAFGHAGQKCSSASLVILVGSVATSERFRRQLADAVSSLRVGQPRDPASQLPPLIQPASGKLLTALTTLGPGEEWLVRPRQLDSEGRLWSPGVCWGVAPHNDFHLTEYFGPVLGVMTAPTLGEAIDLQNATDFGLTAGIHSLDTTEIETWIDGVEAGNLYVNRGITGAIVQRQPFGGWKRSSVGPGAKTGGPNFLFALGRWRATVDDPSEDLALGGISEPVARVITAAQPGIDFLEFDRVRLAAVRDQQAWQTEFGLARDVSALQVERNVFRYRPAPVTIRLAEGAPLGDLVRLLAAATRARSRVWVSSASPLPPSLVELFGDPTSPIAVESVIIETDARWHARLVAGEIHTNRIRLAGGDSSALAGVIRGNLDLAVYAGEVTTAGRVELLTFLREQSVSVTAHRFGIPDARMAALEL